MCIIIIGVGSWLDESPIIVASIFRDGVAMYSVRLGGGLDIGLTSID